MLLKTQLVRGLFTLPLIAMMLLANFAAESRRDALAPPAPDAAPLQGPAAGGGGAAACDKERQVVIRHLAVSAPTDLPRRSLRLSASIDCNAA